MKKQKFSIRYKFLMVTTALLVFCVTAYLLMATTVIRTDKLNLVFDYNRSLVTNISSDVQSLFQNSSDKMELVAYFFRSKSKKSLGVIQKLIHDNSDLVFVSGSEDFKSLTRQFHLDKTYLETYGLEDTYITVELSSQIPFEKIKTDGEAIWNASRKDGPPLIGFGKSVVEEAANGQVVSHYAVVAFIKADKILKSITSGTYNDVLLINKDGELLIHSDADVMRGDRLLETGVVERALNTPARTAVLEMQTDQGKVLGGFSRTYGDQVNVISMVSEAKAFSVVNRLVMRSLLFAMMVGTLAFIAAILFSQSLTRPLEVLVGGMKEVSTGNLETRIDVKSQDEIRVLADQFNAMILDLKQSREQLEEVNRSLEAKVKERTQQLEKQNQAVKSAQEALLRTTRLASVGEIAGRAAHEVLNPLTSILSRIQNVKKRLETNQNREIQLLREITESWREDYSKGGFEELVKNWKQPSSINQEESLWEEDMENLRKLEAQFQLEWKDLISDAEFLIRESERISRIVQSMRNLSIVKSEKRVHKLGPLLDETVNIMADLASKEDITMVVSQPDPNIQVALDRDEFLQSMTNLIRNAIQAIVEKKARGVDADYRGLIQIHARQNFDKSTELLIEDNGIGIEPGNEARLFESQFTTKKREQGTGLGLNISRRFMRAHGGDIALESSTPGEGTVFLVTLPEVSDTSERDVA